MTQDNPQARIEQIRKRWDYGQRDSDVEFLLGELSRLTSKIARVKELCGKFIAGKMDYPGGTQETERGAIAACKQVLSLLEEHEVDG